MAETRELPVYFESVAASDRYADSSINTPTERRPVPNDLVWYDISNIDDTPTDSAVPVNNVRKVTDLALTVDGSDPSIYRSNDLVNMVPATASATDDTAYRPILKDSTGKVVPYNPGVWVADGFLKLVHFRNGVPAGFTPGFTITFWEYTGNKVTSAGGGAFIVDADDGLVAPVDTDYTLGFVVGSDRFDTEADAEDDKQIRLFFDATTGALRAGSISNDSGNPDHSGWDAASRGDNSVALGRGGVASGSASTTLGHANTAGSGSSAALGGENNVIYADAGTGPAILGGLQNLIGDGGFENAFCAIVGGESNRITTATAAAQDSVIVGGNSNVITQSERSVVLAGHSNTMASGAHDSVSGGRLGQVAAGHAQSFVWSGDAAGGATQSVAAGSFVISVAAGTGNFRVYSSGNRVTYGTVSNVDGSWTTGSAGDTKDLQRELGGEEAIASLGNVPVHVWNYKGAAAEARSIGPVAEDWHAAFPSAKDPRRLGPNDQVGVALAAIRGLAARTDRQAAVIESQAATIGRLEEQLATLV